MNKTLLLTLGLMLLKKVIVPVLEDKLKIDLDGDGLVGNKPTDVEKTKEE